MAARECPFCGRLVSGLLTQCTYCREPLPPAPEIRVASCGRSDGNWRGKIRQGLLCMLLAAVVHYFAGGYSAMQLPFPVRPMVTIYLSPLLFLSGLGLSLYALYLHAKT